MRIPLSFRVSASLAAIVCSLSSVVQAVDLFAPNWVIPDDGMPYPSLTASVGDTLTFAWSGGTHDVHIHPTHTCDDPTGSIEIASTEDNPTTYTFVAADGSPEGTVHTFVCQVGQHCEQGMYMNVTGTCFCGLSIIFGLRLFFLRLSIGHYLKLVHNCHFSFCSVFVGSCKQ
jgi:plastocyanin